MDWSIVASVGFIVGLIVLLDLHYWREEWKDKRPIRLERDEDWMPYALMTDLLENEHSRYDRYDES